MGFVRRPWLRAKTPVNPPPSHPLRSLLSTCPASHAGTRSLNGARSGFKSHSSLLGRLLACHRCALGQDMALSSPHKPCLPMLGFQDEDRSRKHSNPRTRAGLPGVVRAGFLEERVTAHSGSATAHLPTGSHGSTWGGLCPDAQHNGPLGTSA